MHCYSSYRSYICCPELRAFSWRTLPGTKAGMYLGSGAVSQNDGWSPTAASHCSASLDVLMLNPHVFVRTSCTQCRISSVSPSVDSTSCTTRHGWRHCPISLVYRILYCRIEEIKIDIFEDDMYVRRWVKWERYKVKRQIQQVVSDTQVIYRLAPQVTAVLSNLPPMYTHTCFNTEHSPNLTQRCQNQLKHPTPHTRWEVALP